MNDINEIGTGQYQMSTLMDNFNFFLRKKKKKKIQVSPNLGVHTNVMKL